tara:strand:+ start:342 stop:2030 length:1689 start_codon:yes stop_codon:yes gene_type:complete
LKLRLFIGITTLFALFTIIDKEILVGIKPIFTNSILINSKKAQAEDKSEIANIAESITVQILGSTRGSGIIIAKENNLYRVLTNWHVVKDEKESDNIGIVTPDGKEHLWKNTSLKRIGNFDLAIIEFSSKKKYQVAILGESKGIQRGNSIYVAGFPLPSISFPTSALRFVQGQVIAKSSIEIPLGYKLLYSNPTLTGMSGGPILNNRGEVVGIHGRAEQNDQVSNQLGKLIATGANQGIPIEKFIGFNKNQLEVDEFISPETVDDYLLKIANIFSQNLAIGLKNEKSFNKIIKFANLGLDLDPYNEDLLIFLGRANLGLSKNKDAIKYANKVISLNNKNIGAYYLRGRIKIELKEYESAINDFKIVISQDPLSLSFNPYKMIGIAYLYLNNHQNAILNFDKALKVNPNDVNTIANRGYSKSQIKDFLGALNDFNQVIEIDPLNSGILANRGDLKLKLKYFDEAIVDYTSAIKLNPNYSYAYVSRGDAKKKLGNNSGAIEDYTRALKINKKELFGYINRGNLFIEKGELKKGCEDLKYAYNLDQKLSVRFIENKKLLFCQIMK